MLDFLSNSTHLSHMNASRRATNMRKAPSEELSGQTKSLLHEQQQNGTRMVDRLRQSLEQLEPPICLTCHIEMRWTRSELLVPDPVTILHVFHCPTCHRTEETKSFSKAASIPPAQLSAPWQRLRPADLAGSNRPGHSRRLCLLLGRASV
jgi:hypothetical protein